MYRMKGNHGPRGARMASEAFALPIALTLPGGAGKARSRLLLLLAAGIGAGLVVFGVAGLVVAASREETALPGEHISAIDMPRPALFEGARDHQLSHLVFAEPEQLA